MTRIDELVLNIMKSESIVWFLDKIIINAYSVRFEDKANINEYLRNPQSYRCRASRVNRRQIVVGL